MSNKLIIPEKLKKEGKGNYWIKLDTTDGIWRMAELHGTKYGNIYAYVMAHKSIVWDHNIAEIGEEIVMGNSIEKLTEQLLKLTPSNQEGYMFPEYYPHTDKIMWKIMNPYTQYNQEKVVLHPVEEGMEKSLTAAIQYLENAKKFHDPK